MGLKLSIFVGPTTWVGLWWSCPCSDTLDCATARKVILKADARLGRDSVSVFASAFAEQPGGMSLTDNLPRGRGFWSGSGGTFLGSGARRALAARPCFFRNVSCSVVGQAPPLLAEFASPSRCELVAYSSRTRRRLVADSSQARHRLAVDSPHTRR